jgi:hypothetical protein
VRSTTTDEAVGDRSSQPCSHPLRGCSTSYRQFAGWSGSSHLAQQTRSNPALQGHTCHRACTYLLCGNSLLHEVLWWVSWRGSPRWHARGQGFKSPQLHQAQRISRLHSERHLPEICQKTRPVALGTLCVLSGWDPPPGLLSDLQHHPEALLDRRRGTDRYLRRGCAGSGRPSS